MSGLRTRSHKTRGRRPRVRSLFVFSKNRLLTRGLPWILEKGGGGSEVYSSMEEKDIHRFSSISYYHVMIIMLSYDDHHVN